MKPGVFIIDLKIRICGMITDEKNYPLEFK